METAAQPLLLSVEDYLNYEADGQVRHECVRGRVHAMAGTSERHNLIAPETREVTVHRREEAWRPVVVTQPEALVEFRSIQLTIPLAQAYEGVR
jgi:Uma2 family endonuclease